MRLFKLRKIIDKHSCTIVYNDLEQKIHDNMLCYLPHDYDAMKVERINSGVSTDGTSVFIIHLKQ